MEQDCDGPTPPKRPNNGVTEEERNNEDARLVKWFCEDLGPYCILDYNGCRNYFNETIPNYTLPSKKKFLEELIPEQYKIESTQLKKTLQSVDHVAITIDTWKYALDSRRRRPIIMWTATVHYVHKGKFVSQILFTKEVKPKSKEEIVKKSLIEWCLLSKIVCFVTGFEKNDTLLQSLNNLKIPHLFCAAATLRLTFRQCFDYLLTDEEFKKKQQVIPESSKKKKDEPFCWHNQYADLQNISDNTTGEEGAELTECVKILKPFVDLADELSKMQYSTLSSILPLIVGLKSRIAKIFPSSNRAKGLKNTLLGAIDSHFGPYEDEQLATKATFIDPRFTKAALPSKQKACLVEEIVLKELYGQDPENPITSSNPDDQPEATTSTSSYPNGQTNAIPSTSSNPPGNPVPENDVKLTESPFGFLDELVKSEMSNNVIPMIIVKQIKIPKIRSTDDPFKFWDKYESSFENKLFRMSQKYLCIPATVVPAEPISGECLWKKVVPNFNERRNQIDLVHVNKILFLHSYYSNNNNN